MNGKLIAETFTCSQSGSIEYGFTFRRVDGEDAVFDVVLGEAEPGSQDVIERDWAKFQWVADAIVKGQP